MDKKQISAYLRDYIIYLRDNKLTKDYNELITIKKDMRIFLENNYKKYNKLDELFETRDEDTKNTIVNDIIIQSGGTKIEEKLIKIKDVLDTYKKIDINEINAKLQRITGKINSLVDVINKIDANDPEHAKYDDFINDIETIQPKLEATDMRIKFNTNRKKLYLNQKFIPAKKDEIIVNLEQTIANFLTSVMDNRQKIADDAAQQIEYNELAHGIEITYTRIDYENKYRQLLANIDTVSKKIKEIKDMTDGINISKNDLCLFDKLDLLEKHAETNGTDELKTLLRDKEMQFVTKIGKLRDYIKKSNEHYLAKYKINTYPEFNGECSASLKQNILYKSIDESKIQAIAHLYNSLNTKQQIKLEEIYKIPDDMIKKDNMIKKGGTKEAVESIIGRIKKIEGNIAIYNAKYDEYVRQLDEYNILAYDTYIHTIFLVSVITNKLFSGVQISIYNFLNKGLIDMYRRTINDVLNSINKDKNSEINKYMRKYHYITLLKLGSFFNKISGMIGAKEIVDINNCKNAVAENFLLFNYFKFILDAYKELFLNKVSIYARLNDIGIKGHTEFKYGNGNEDKLLGFNDEYKTGKMFASDYDRYTYEKLTKGDPVLPNTELMYVRKEVCPKLKDTGKSQDDNTEKIKFTEVYDAVNYESNEAIAQSMLMNAQISQGKGIAAMTYGYSGTGKTYTLFGSSQSYVQGILQATINTITDIAGLRLRVFELYGYGQTYPYYWKLGLDGIEHFLMDYNLSVQKLATAGATPELQINRVNVKNAKSIAAYVENTESTDKVEGTFLTIEPQNIRDVLFKFDKFVQSVETRRETGHTIEKKCEGACNGQQKSYKHIVRTVRDTPNNIVSSRSVIIYDFRVKVADKEVPFLIIDLPGKEEIEQTYVEKYCEDDVIKKVLGVIRPADISAENYLKFIKTMVLTMALNPIALPLFSFLNKGADRMNGKIIDIFNSESLEDRYNILNTNINMHHQLVNKLIPVKFADEPINRYDQKIAPKIVDTGKLNNDNKVVPLGSFFGHNYDMNNGNSSVKAILEIHLLNRLLMLGRYDILEKINKKYCDFYINNDIDKLNITFSGSDVKINAITVKFNEIQNIKGGLYADLERKMKVSKGIQDNQQISNEDKVEIIKKMLKYDYYLTPLEGIYINENIIGLIKFLGTHLTDGMRDDEKAEFEKKIEEQSTDLDFFKQQQATRFMLSVKQDAPFTSDNGTRYSRFYETNIPVNEHFFDNSVNSYNFENVQKYFDRLSLAGYTSNKIFNKQTPIITDVLTPYVPNSGKGRPQDKIVDYKVFYLFGNYINTNLRDMKCENQYKLLKNTENFINIITGKN